ncbi:hypothetical protein [Candidatus Nitronereus thalassa]|uniref:Uncharacterized protein n=1 Tax=Candidatus Nitronereus thalassa TaxID=3020898 RepID=A0ABU3K8G4_9BACT|nr:hypothetical protein [Candidatus Nitronereus thalassa]MDT7042678.1 hypothetical protein [Candidatus Nitronereus thalassa]
MKRSWTLIGKRCPDDHEVRQVWYEIFAALKQSEIPFLSKTEMRDQFLRIGRNSKKLADMIGDGPLDLMAFEFFPNDDAEIAFDKSNWSDLNLILKMSAAHKSLCWWPSMRGLLHEVARQAEILAKKAFTEKRIVDRDTADRQANYFFRKLAKYFHKHLGGSMEATLANIGSVVFDKQIDKKMVRQALRHEKRDA